MKTEIKVKKYMKKYDQSLTLLDEHVVSSWLLFCRVAAHNSARHRKLLVWAKIAVLLVRAGALSRWVTGSLRERLARSHWGQHGRLFPLPKLVPYQPQVLFRGMIQFTEEKTDWGCLQLNTLKFVGFIPAGVWR